MRFVLRHAFLILGIGGLLGFFAFEAAPVIRALVLPQYVVWQLITHLRVAIAGPTLEPGVLYWLVQAMSLLAGLAPYALLDAVVRATLRESVAPRST
jgi:hypothetical protein